VGDVRRVAAQWPLRGLSRWLQVIVAGVIAAWLAAVAAAASVTPLLAGQLRLFAVLVACGAAAVELTRRCGEPGAVDRDVYAIWDLPAAVLLPPLYALLVPVPKMIVTQLRIRRAPVHRRAYTVSAVGLGYAAACLAFHAAAPALGTGTGTGVRALAWTALAAGCGLVRLAVNDGLILAAVRGSAPGTPLLPEIIGPEALYGNVTELSLSTLSAFAAARSPLLLLWALPLVVMLQRGLRYAQVRREARTDAKTGLLNDATWRREAAAEIARAARTRAALAIGIIDLDRFKDVNDTYGHAAGDAVLAAAAVVIAAELREYDIAGRVGGEEIAFALPGASYPEAVAVAQRLRAAIARMPLAGAAGIPMPPQVTASIGVAAAGWEAGWDLARYYGLADAALYAAKRGGRDCVWGVCGDEGAGLAPRPGTARAALPARATGELGT
jgi:diguanylate cyclase (GGDEF)-like protein